MSGLRLLLPASLAAAAVASCGGDPAASGGDGGASSSFTSSTTASTSIGPGASSGGGGGPRAFAVEGRVVDANGAPVAGAVVMQGGAAVPTETTAADGRFSITLTRDLPGQPTIVAAKMGSRAAGLELDDAPAAPIDLVLVAANPPDATSYAFGAPGTGDPLHDATTSFCGHCHTTFTAQFQGSKHAESARDPLVQDRYAGVTEAFADEAACVAAGYQWATGKVPGRPTESMKKCYAGAGVLGDMNPGCGGPGSACDDPALAVKPTRFGACADCHAPGIAGSAGGRDLHDATGIAFEDGNHCDVCHHVRDVDLAAPAGVAGRLILQRPSEHVDPSNPISPLRQVMFGPLVDVPNSFMGGSFQPKFRTAELCAGCHQYDQQALIEGQSLDAARWPTGLPVHSTYAEWIASPSAPETPCQDCHMPPDASGLTNSLDVTTPDSAGLAFGFPRPPGDTRQHVFRGPLAGSPRLIDGAVSFGVETAVVASSLVVTTHATNTGAGHAIPTGEPMRALVVLVEATGCGAALAPVGGQTVGDLGGALAAASAGGDASFAGATLTWIAAARAAKPGDVVRVARPTGTFVDYVGVAPFAGSLTPQQKGVELQNPVGSAKVLSIAGDALTLDATLSVVDGDRVYLGDAIPAPPLDGLRAGAYAGAVGALFSRVLVDATGARGAPHHRAIDLVSDDRLVPGADRTTTHTFALPTTCASIDVRATLLYRPTPVDEARLRGWDARDYAIAARAVSVPVP